MNDQLATRLVIERETGKTVEVLLRRPLTIAEVYYHFVARGKHPATVSLSGGVARVTFVRARAAG